jgi:hypothetical protein
VHKFLNFSFLSPKIVTAVLEGKQPPALTYRKLEKLYENFKITIIDRVKSLFNLLTV